MSLEVPKQLWAQTLEQLRRCGGGRVECVAYWLASLDAPRRVESVVHPRHVSTASYYEVDRAWLHDFVVSLRRNRRTAVAQVHTHAGAAFHSRTDDENALVNSPGFLSLVIPRFARAPVRGGELFLAELATDGRWNEVRFHEHIGGPE